VAGFDGNRTKVTQYATHGGLVFEDA
jgi:hypothetical protein